MTSLKNIITILKLSLKNPRFLIDSIQIKWKPLVGLALISILIVSLGQLGASRPMLDQMNQDLLAAKDHIPQYYYQLGQLKLDDQAKPLYYQSPYFQLVIDDQVRQNNAQDPINLGADKAQAINRHTFLNLFMFKNRTYAILAGQIYQLPQGMTLLSQPDNLNVLLNYFDRHKVMVFAYMWFGFFLVHIPMYAFHILILALFLQVFNVRLTQKLPFSSRSKLAIVNSFYPLLFISLVNLFIPLVGLPYNLTLALAMGITYLMFRSHTFYIMKVTNHLKASDISKKDIMDFIRKQKNSQEDSDSDPKRSDDKDSHPEKKQDKHDSNHNESKSNK